MLETTKNTTTTTTTNMDILPNMKNTSVAVSAIEVSCNETTNLSNTNSTKSKTTTTKQNSLNIEDNIELPRGNPTATHKSFRTNIFSWLKSAATANSNTANNNTYNKNNNNNNNRLSAPPLRSKSPDTTTFRDFRGVQSLRHLWNKRISANAESAYRNNKNNKHKLTKSISCLVNATTAPTTTSTTTTTTTSSLNNTSTVAEDNLNGNPFERVTEIHEFSVRPNRAQSLYDCRHFGIESEVEDIDINETTTTTTATPTPAITAIDGEQLNCNITEEAEALIDSLHREKDNFYKYKTAEQAAVHLAREARARAKTKRVTASGEGTAFSASSSGGVGHIHWPRRGDLKTTSTQSEQCTSNLDLQLQDISPPNMAIKDKQLSATSTETMAKISTETEILSTLNDVISACDSTHHAHHTKPAKVNNSDETVSSSRMRQKQTNNNNENDGKLMGVCGEQQQHQHQHHHSHQSQSPPQHSTASLSPASSDTDTLTATNSPRHSGSTATQTERESSATESVQRKKHDGGIVHRDSITCGQRRNATRRTPSTSSTSSNGARKYSFKTHSRNYHPPRKMHYRERENGLATSNAATIGASGSLVSKLTQQFNEMIQKDKTLLDEVRRKNGVLLTRGGHVYKVIDKHDPQQFRNANTNANVNTSNSPTVSRTSSHGSRDSNASSPRTSVVQRTIKKFEQGNEKPQVSAKSQQVLSKQPKVIIAKVNSDATTATAAVIAGANQNIKRQSLGLPLATQQQQQQESTGCSVNEPTTLLPPKKAMHSMLFSPPPLEVVKEEAKTPLECEDKTTAAFISGATQTLASADVPIANIAVDTFCTAEDAKCAAKPTVQSVEVANYATPFKKVEPSKLKLQASCDAAEVNSNSSHSTSNIGSSVETVSVETASSDGGTLEEHSTESESGNTKPRSKNKYAKIYERFRFRSPFGSSSTNSSNNNKKQSSLSPPSSTSASSPSSPKSPKSPTSPKAQSPERRMPRLLFSQEYEAVTPTDIDDEPEALKLLNAIQVIDQKLKDLTTSKSNALVNDPVANQGIVICSNDDFEQRVQPNNSFIYQSCAKQVTNNTLLIAQAVNVTLVNSIESEQMIMEQKNLPDFEHISAPQPSTYVALSNSPTMEATPSTKITTNTTTVDETIYEMIIPNQLTPKKTEAASPQQSFVFQSQQKALTATTHTDDIYQTLEETKKEAEKSQPPTASNLNDYESIAGSCEQSTEALRLLATKMHDDGYEICEPSPSTPDANSSQLTAPTLFRNTNDELPELPKPKRRLPKSPLPNHHPPKETVAPATIVESTAIPTAITALPIEDTDEHHYYADDENIYDTIKGSHCYESLHAQSGKLQKSDSAASSSDTGGNNMPVAVAADNVSLNSNCYESITNYRRVVRTSNCGHATGSSSGSTLTISSDHKTNSLYEVSVTAGLLYNGTTGRSSGRTGRSSSAASTVDSGESTTGAGKQCYKFKACKIGGGDTSRSHNDDSTGQQPTMLSDNSDEWIDISESDADATEKQQFIVVRERFKAHRSPDWSKRVRDKRLQKKKAVSCIEDDSDHYYETLSPLGTKRHSTHLVMQPQDRNGNAGNSCNGRLARRSDLKLPELRVPHHNKKYYNSAHALGASTTSDDYDSFESDTDGVYDVDPELNTSANSLRKEVTKLNDSGVDVRHNKLPDPPPHSTKVYAIVKKLKKFISNKKSHSSSASKTGSQQKLYENTSQFYVDDNHYGSTPKSSSKSQSKSSSKKPLPTPTTPHEDYENTEFHAPPNALLNAGQANNGTAKSLSNSEKNLNSTYVSNTDLQQSNDTISRSKSKAGKSFKSRLRKSLVGSSSDAKQLSALAPARSTFYIEDPNNGGYGELDSGFSEKASSGDLPVVPNTANVPTAESQKFSTTIRKAKKEAKCAQRRRTTIGIRPQDPPPPPPDDTVSGKAKFEKSTTSWYAECGVFKSGTSLSNDHLDERSLGAGSKSATYSQSGSSTAHGNSWYTEAGLYQTSGVSVASSSGSSGVSTGNEAGIGDELAHSLFMNEPLYQIYNAAKLESISRDLEDNDGSTDGYEEIGQTANAHGSGSRVSGENRKHFRPSALQLVGPKQGPSRTLWSEIPEVINSCILMTLTPRERALQEAKFEILTSEASYLKSLNLLRTHFMNHPVFRDTNIVSARDRKALFSYIVPVHECSERLLTELESCWQSNIMLLGLSKRIYTIAEKHFHVYIAFCEHQGRMDRTLRRLKDVKSYFSQNLDLLESSPTCCGLNLHSFLMLPMQRITRLPLLIDAVFSKVSPNDDDYESWKMTLAIMNKIVTQCNEAANRCEQAYEIERISRQLEFPNTIRALAIAPVGVPAPGSKPRYLVKKGELTHLIWRGDDIKLTFGKKFAKSTIFAFLFSDLLVLTKRKAEEQFTVFDYCPRNMLTISSSEVLPQLPTKDLNQTGKNLILMTLLENHERKTVELVLSCPSVSEQERWLQAMRPPEAETPGEKLYEQWDCPQVIAKHTYDADEPDALNLEIGDVVNVTRKLPDGWYQGERLRDGAMGWFPGSFTEEVNSAHVRARNLKQRYRLLTFTASYLETRKQK